MGLRWKFTTFLFVVASIESIIVGLYLSIDFVSQPPQSLYSQSNNYAVFGIVPKSSALSRVRDVTFRELFKDESAIEKRLPKLLHDYFKENHPTSFSAPELVSLLNLEMNQVRQFALQKDTVIIFINPHMPTSDEAVQSIAVKKDLLAHELKDEYKAATVGRQPAHLDYEITVPPRSGSIVNPQEKMLALTFDDGPDGNTHALLDTLDKYEASATFFVLGQKVTGGAGVLQRMVREGHEIGNHSWNHPDLRTLPPQQVHLQIADTQSAIKSATGIAPSQMRPPYGAINAEVQQEIDAQGLRTAMWSVDTNDWRDRDPNVLYQRIVESAGDGKIILLHDIHGASVQAAIRAIPELKAQGYQLVTLSQCNAHR